MRCSRLGTPEHTHNYFELIHVLSGSCRYIINGNTLLLHAGDFCLLPPNAQHTQAENPEIRALKLLIHPSYFTKICTGLLNYSDSLGTFLIHALFTKDCGEYLLFRTNSAPDTCTHFLVIGKFLLQNKFQSDRVACGLLMAFLSELATDFPSVLYSTTRKNESHKILMLLYQNYNKITLAQLANQLHYTVPYCSKYIRRLFGCTFSQLLRQVRFQKAEYFLRNSAMTVEQIGKKIGYENPENFIRAFKSQYQMTPTQYRNQHLTHEDTY